MFKDIFLKFGRNAGNPPEAITTTPITVFVGPNNSGKSLVLNEINQFCTNGQINATWKILDNIIFTGTSEDDVAEKIRHVQLQPNRGETQHPNHIFVGKKGARHQVPEQTLKNVVADPSLHVNQFCSWYLSYNTLILDGKNRINLVNQQEAGDLQSPASSSFQVLFRDNEKRAEVRRIIHDAFGDYLVIDPTSMRFLRLRLSSREPVSEIEERGIHEEAIDFHNNASLIDHASDGVKAFTGMITEIIAGDPMVLLIDEPEAFLHPALSFKLGKEISQITADTQKRLCVSTHSSSFVMGCIQSGAPVNIVRLTYRAGNATARILTSADLLPLMRNPMLRSTGVLGALFYEFVIVTEADTDRAYYQEINERLLAAGDIRGIPNCLFLNAQNKQTVKSIIKPLRELGIPTVGIVDIDVVKDGGGVWTGFMESFFIPNIERQPLGTVRANVKRRLEDTGQDMKKDGGLELLNEDDREGANNLFDRLSEYGLFVVRRGELESWMEELNVGGHGPSWLVKVFEKMGDEPDSEDYIAPSNGDVWDFIGQIKQWFVDPVKKGIPS